MEHLLSSAAIATDQGGMSMQSMSAKEQVFYNVGLLGMVQPHTSTTLV
jgi:hypothetical protein